MPTATSPSAAHRDAPVKRTRGGTQPAPLSRSDVLDAAMPLLAAHGVDGLTVKAVADRLGISSPAVYHHVDGRDDLLDRLCERVAAEVNRNVARTLVPDMRWDDAIVAVLLEMDRTFARYPGVAARVLPQHRPSPAEAQSTDTVRSLLIEGGFDRARADAVLSALQYLFAGWLLRQRATNQRELDHAIRWLLKGAA
jgi:TetR/AcrR family transcriptional regulator, tetracycline repressor protein